MIEKKGYLKIIKRNKLRSKKNLYLRNGPAIFIFKINSLKRNLYDMKLLNYVMSEKNSLDINNRNDLKKFH
jgi:CMP-N-acetylneuraminic acid synthetase